MKKLFLSLVLVVVLSVFGLGWLATQVYGYIDQDIESEYQGDFFVFEELGESLSSLMDEDIEQGRLVLASWPTHRRVRLAVVSKSEYSLPLELMASFESGQALQLEDEEELSLSYFLKNTQQVLTLSLNKEFIIKPGSDTDLMLTLLFYFGLVISVLLWLSPLLRRLVLLQRSTTDFGSGQLESRIKNSRWSYITEIEKSFNNMAERIQSLVADNKLLSRAVSHDLKTPLARLRFGVETLFETQDDKLRTQYLHRIVRDLDEMESLVQTLLQYAKLDEAAVGLEKSKLDLNDFISELVKEFEVGRKRITLELDQRRPEIYVDPTYFRMMVNNILVNAIQYSDERILIQSRISDGGVYLIVGDDGYGIPELDRENILKPFIRGRMKEGCSGFGMGLAIVSKIAEWHEIKLLIGDSNELKGAEFSFFLD